MVVYDVLYKLAQKEEVFRFSHGDDYGLAMATYDDVFTIHTGKGKKFDIPHAKVVDVDYDFVTLSFNYYGRWKIACPAVDQSQKTKDIILHVGV